MSKRKAFTLIELLIVIAITGILATVVIAGLNGGTIKSKKKAFIAEVKGSISGLVNKCNNESNIVAGDFPATGNATWTISGGSYTQSCGRTGNGTFNFLASSVKVTGCSATVTNAGAVFTAQCQ